MSTGRKTEEGRKGVCLLQRMIKSTSFFFFTLISILGVFSHLQTLFNSVEIIENVTPFNKIKTTRYLKTDYNLYLLIHGH